MYKVVSKQTVMNQVMNFMEQDCNVPISEMAKKFAYTEGEVTFVLPNEMVSPLSGIHAQRILEKIPEWGELMTIVISLGSVFEFKGAFPKGRVARGYYNLMGEPGQIQGHILLDSIEHLAIVSKPFRGKESHYIGFYNDQGNCIFKVYLGRDIKRNLFPEQVKKLQQLKKEVTTW